MKKILFLIVIAIACYVMFSGCSTKKENLKTPITKEAYLSQFENFVVDAEKNGKSFTTDEWKLETFHLCKYMFDYKQTFTEEFTENDISKIESLINRYATIYLKSTKD